MQHRLLPADWRDRPAKRRFALIWTAIAGAVLVLTTVTLSAAEFTWDGDCGGPPADRWNAICDFSSKSNWTDDPNLPGPMDTVTIPTAFPAPRLGTSFEIQSCSIQSGLRITGANTLKLTTGSSNIEDLDLSGGIIEMAAGATLWVWGDSGLGGTIKGPGPVLVQGTVDLEGVVLNNNASVSLNTTVSATGFHISVADGSFLSGVGEVSIMLNPGTDITGTGWVTDLTIQAQGGGSTNTFIDTILDGVGIKATNGADVDLRGSELGIYRDVDIGEGSVVDIAAVLPGGTGRTLHPTTLQGLGLLDVREDMVVGPGVASHLGQGTAQSGMGGLRLQKEFHLEGEFRNHGRFRFFWGDLVGVGPFVNQGGAWAYTLSSGPGFSSVDIVNGGTFQIGTSFDLNGTATLVNLTEGTVQMHPYDNGTVSINGSGQLINHGSFVLLGPGGGFANVNAGFQNLGVVHAVSNSIHFRGDVANIDAQGKLSGGWWIAEPGTVIDFFDSNVRIIAAFTRVTLKGFRPFRGLGDLEEIDDGSWLELLDGATMTTGAPFLVSNSSGVLVGEDSQITFPGSAMLELGSTLQVSADATASVGQSLELGDATTTEPTAPELQGLMVDGSMLPPTVVTPTLNNHGRVLPTERETVGVMVLDGSYVQHANGRIHIEADDSTTDRLEISGDATLGGILEVRELSGMDPSIGQHHTVLTTNGQVTGTFNEVVTDSEVTVIYNPQSVEIVFVTVFDDTVFDDGFENGATGAWTTTVP